MVMKEDNNREINTISSDIKLIAARMEEGFKSSDKRFTLLTGLISIGFVTVTVLITVFQFLS